MVSALSFVLEQSRNSEIVSPVGTSIILCSTKRAVESRITLCELT